MDFLIDLVTPYLGKETLKGAWAMGFFGRPWLVALLFGCFRAKILYKSLKRRGRSLLSAERSLVGRWMIERNEFESAKSKNQKPRGSYKPLESSRSRVLLRMSLP